VFENEKKLVKEEAKKALTEIENGGAEEAEICVYYVPYSL